MDRERSSEGLLRAARRVLLVQQSHRRVERHVCTDWYLTCMCKAWSTAAGTQQSLAEPFRKIRSEILPFDLTFLCASALVGKGSVPHWLVCQHLFLQGAWAIEVVFIERLPQYLRGTLRENCAGAGCADLALQTR